MKAACAVFAETDAVGGPEEKIDRVGWVKKCDGDCDEGVASNGAARSSSGAE